VQDHILNHIEEYFEEMESEFGDKHIQLDTLEMTFDSDDITKVNSVELKSLVHLELDKTIKKIREAELVESNDTAAKNDKLNGSHKSQDGSLSESNEPSGLSVLSKKERALESIVQFLKTGVKPWWIPSNDEMVELMDERTVLLLIQEKSTFFVQLLKKELRSTRFVQRIIRQFSNEVLLLLFATQFNEKSIQFSRLKSLVKSDAILPVIEQLSNKEKEVFWKTVSKKFHQKKSSERIEAFHSEIKKIPSINEESIEKLVVFGLSIQSTPRLLVANSEEMYSALEKSVHSYLTSEVSNLEQELKDQSKQKDQSQAESKLKTDTESESERNSKTDPESDAENNSTSEDSSTIQSKSDLKSKLEKSDSDQEANPDSSSESDVQSSKDIELDKEKQSERDKSIEKDKNNETHSSIEKESSNDKGSDKKGSSSKKAIEDALKSNAKKAEEAASQSLEENDLTLSKQTQEDEMEKHLNEARRNDAEEKAKFEKVDKTNFIAENAGLVLIHPFLKMFFTNVGLLNDKELTDPVRAAHYLHYAATGREYDFEFSMTFEKYICGVPLSEPIEKNIEISDEVKASIDEMLLAVLGHWKALKTESIDLLRHEFLMREGKVIIDESSPRIIVERKTVDIMLDKLPWGLGIVGFPWKDELIYVEW
jgi:hypothetical protein